MISNERPLTAFEQHRIAKQRYPIAQTSAKCLIVDFGAKLSYKPLSIFLHVLNKLPCHRIRCKKFILNYVIIHENDCKVSIFKVAAILAHDVFIIHSQSPAVCDVTAFSSRFIVYWVPLSPFHRGRSVSH